MRHSPVQGVEAGSNPVPRAKSHTMKRKRDKFVAAVEVRAIARERVGKLPAPRVMVPKPLRKAKYKPEFEDVV